MSKNKPQNQVPPQDRTPLPTTTPTYSQPERWIVTHNSKSIARAPRTEVIESSIEQWIKSNNYDLHILFCYKL